MKPVLNSLIPQATLPGSMWLPAEGGGYFSTDLGLVIVDEIVDTKIYYHYERCGDPYFSQPAENFYQFARRVA